MKTLRNKVLIIAVLLAAFVGIAANPVAHGTYRPHFSTVDFREATSVLLPSTGVTGNVTVSTLDASGLNAATVTLNATQIKALHTSAQTLVAAPATGHFIQIDSITVTVTEAGAQFTGANALEFRFTDGSGTKVSADIASSVIDTATTATHTVRGIDADTAMTLAAAVVVAVPVADPGGSSATGTMKITVHYRDIAS